MPVHAMGINAMCLVPSLLEHGHGVKPAVAEAHATMEEGAVRRVKTRHLLFVFTGGDDQALGLTLLELSRKPAEPIVAPTGPDGVLPGTPWDVLDGGLLVKVRASGRRECAHSAGIRGVSVMGGRLVVSAGADCRLYTWAILPWDFPRALLPSEPSLPVAQQSGWVEAATERRHGTVVAIEQVHGVCAVGDQLCVAGRGLQVFTFC
jgi:hypothetical protein